MTDSEYLFKQDIWEKKTIGHSAAKRVGKRKKVTFPHDNLSKKEIDKMSGEVKTYNLNQPMKWAQYKAMPDDLRREYLTWLIRLYNASNAALGQMLGVSDNCVRVERKRLGIPPCPKATKTAPEFYNFVKFGSPGAVADEKPEVQAAPPTTEIKPPKPPTVEILETSYTRALGFLEGFAALLCPTQAEYLSRAADMLNGGLIKKDGGECG